MQYPYPLLQKVFNHYFNPDRDFSDIKLYSCMHLLGPQLEMYKYFIHFGLLPENIVALGKVYSSNSEVIEELKSLGVHVVQTPFSNTAFDVDHTSNSQEVTSKMTDGKNVILDDGGYVLEAAHDKAVLFGVEQTSAGYHKLKKQHVHFPIYNVARSSIKLTQESPYIVLDAYQRIEDTLSFADKKVLIIGQGVIGRSLLELLQQKNIDVVGFDKETSREELVKYLRESKPDIVVGATGERVVMYEDLRQLESSHMYTFVSISSSDREFPVAHVRKNESVHDDVVFKNFTFINNGFPISFAGKKDEMPPHQMEKTIALLMGSILHGLTHVSSGEGFVDLPDELCRLVES